MNAEEIKLDESLKDKHIDFTDKWIMSRFQNAIREFEYALDKIDINGAAKIIYNFIWSDYCDWYLELSKERLYSNKKEIKGAVLYRSILLFEDMMKLLHPFMPFISEEIWHLISERKAGSSISVSKFPVYNNNLVDPEAEKEIEFVRGVITGIRNIRGEMNIPPSKKLKVMLKTRSVSNHQEKYIKNLARISKLVIKDNLEKPPGSASAVVKDCDIFIPLEGLIDVEVEKNRLQKEISRLEGLLKGVSIKLSNEDFVSKAPPDVVSREKAKQKDWTESLEKFKTLLDHLK
jgi:valyl-tRNA synthetase